MRSVPNLAETPAAPRWTGVAVVSGLCGAALLLRAWFAARGGLWSDEGQFVQILGLPSLGGMIEFVRSQETHPPLFYVLMRAWQSVVGRADDLARVPPILMGVALVPAVYCAGARMLGHRTARIAAVLTAFSTTLAMFSVTVRPYSLTPLLCLASCCALWRGLAADARAWPWAAWIAATLGLLYTHNWGWLVWAGQCVAVAAWALTQDRTARRVALGHWAMVQVALAVGYAPWLSALVHQMARTRPGPLTVSGPGYALRYFLETTTALPPLAAAVLLAALVAATALRRGGGAERPPLTEDRRRALYVLAGVPLGALPVAAAISARSNVLLHHCIVTLAPCVLLAVAYGIARLSPAHRPRLAALVTAGLALLYVAEASVLSREIRSNARELAAAVARRARADDIILIAPGWLAPVFNHYYRGSNPEIAFPREDGRGPNRWDGWWLEMAAPEPLARARQRLLREHEAGHRIWLVMERRMLDDGVPERAALLEGPDPIPIVDLGGVRANQLRRLLWATCGPPDTTAVPPDRRRSREMLDAYLFPAARPRAAGATGAQR